MKAIQVWKEGGDWYELWDGRDMVATVANRDEAAAYGATEFVETEEPRFLVRDGSGRNWAAEWHYTDFDTDRRAYMEETYGADGEQEENQTLGEWLDSSYAGDEFDDSDNMLTIIRIN